MYRSNICLKTMAHTERERGWKVGALSVTHTGRISFLNPFLSDAQALKIYILVM